MAIAIREYGILLQSKKCEFIFNTQMKIKQLSHFAKVTVMQCIASIPSRPQYQRPYNLMYARSDNPIDWQDPLDM